MAKEYIPDEMLDDEILRLQNSHHVKLARREENIRNRKANMDIRQYLEDHGVTQRMDSSTAWTDDSM